MSTISKLWIFKQMYKWNVYTQSNIPYVTLYCHSLYHLPYIVGAWNDRRIRRRCIKRTYSLNDAWLWIELCNLIILLLNVWRVCHKYISINEKISSLWWEKTISKLWFGSNFKLFNSTWNIFRQYPKYFSSPFNWNNFLINFFDHCDSISIK